MTAVANFIDKLSDLAAAGVLASFGGAAQALYQIYKGDKPFSLLSFIICVLLSFFVGQVVGSMIPESLGQYHDGLLLMSGFSVFPLLDVINSNMTKMLKGLISKAIPVSSTPDDTNNQETK